LDRRQCFTPVALLDSYVDETILHSIISALDCISKRVYELKIKIINGKFLFKMRLFLSMRRNRKFSTKILCRLKNKVN